MKLRQRGQAAIFVSMSLVVTLGMLGLVVDLGWALWRKEACKAAAQAAASAGVKVAFAAAANWTCGGIGGCYTNTPCPATLNTPGNAVQAACLYAKQNGFTDDPVNGTQRVLITVQNGTPPVPGLSPAFWMSATVSERLPQWFSVLLGDRVTVRARATAGYFQPNVGGCIYGLNQHGYGLTNSGNVTIQSACGFYINSDDPQAVNLNGNPHVIATNGSGVYIRGGCGSSCSDITPVGAIHLGVPLILDPFSALEPPTVGSCTNPGVSLGSHDTGTIDPGVICNGINLSGQSSLTLNPGLYIVKGGISVSGQAEIHGNGVSIYNLDGTISMTGGTVIDLTAPTSGDWQGILFYQDRLNTNAATLVGGSSATINGVLYFPGAQLSLAGGASSHEFRATVVADTISMVGNTYISDPVTTKYTSGTAGVFLIE